MWINYDQGCQVCATKVAQQPITISPVRWANSLLNLYVAAVFYRCWSTKTVRSGKKSTHRKKATHCNHLNVATYDFSTKQVFFSIITTGYCTFFSRVKFGCFFIFIFYSLYRYSVVYDYYSVVYGSMYMVLPPKNRVQNAN